VPLFAYIVARVSAGWEGHGAAVSTRRSPPAAGDTEGRGHAPAPRTSSAMYTDWVHLFTAITQ